MGMEPSPTPRSRSSVAARFLRQWWPVAAIFGCALIAQKLSLSGYAATGHGIEHSEAVCEYLWNSHAAAIASDTFAVESFPADMSEQARPFGFLHNVLIGQFGMALGELWWLGDLASDCAAREKALARKVRRWPTPQGATPGQH